MHIAQTIHRLFPTEDDCLEALFHLRFQSPTCPHCKRCDAYHRHPHKPCFTCTCGHHHIYPRAGSIFGASKLPLKTWLVAMALLFDTPHYSPRQLAQTLKITYTTARHMRQKINGANREWAWCAILVLHEEKKAILHPMKTPTAYIASLEEPRKRDIKTLHALIKKTVPQWKPFMMEGHPIIGYGKYAYTSTSGCTGDWFCIGLSSRKRYISLYVCSVKNGKYLAELYAKKLPKARIGKSCIRFRSLEDIDLKVITTILNDAKKLGPMGDLHT